MALQLLAAAPQHPSLPFVASHRRLPPPSPPSLCFLHQTVDSTCRSNFARLSCRGAEHRWRRSSERVRAGASGERRESPYEVLGVSPSVAPNEIKRAYRRLALRYHPDVNKEANAQEKFLRIKHAYNTDELRKPIQVREPPPGPGRAIQLRQKSSFMADFVKDLQTEFQNWEAGLNSDQKPKSLWEELSAIDEEFVEFLESELKVDDSNSEGNTGNDPYTRFGGQTKNARDDKTAANSFDDGVSEAEAALVKLKKELGLG